MENTDIITTMKTMSISEHIKHFRVCDCCWCSDRIITLLCLKEVMKLSDIRDIIMSFIMKWYSLLVYNYDYMVKDITSNILMIECEIGILERYKFYKHNTNMFKNYVFSYNTKEPALKDDNFSAFLKRLGIDLDDKNKRNSVQLIIIRKRDSYELWLKELEYIDINRQEAVSVFNSHIR